MRIAPLLFVAALAASLPAHAIEGYVGAGVTQAPSEDEYRPIVGVSAKEDNDPYARIFGGVWINENFAVEAAYHDFGRSKFDAVADEKHVWIGLRKRSGPDATCDPPTPDTDWVWSDNSSLDYLDWIPGEPNNQFCSVPDNLENCGELKQSSFPSAVGWNDTPCEFPGHGYICKARRDMIFIP